MKNVMKKNKGFTIVELVIVIAVIAILAGVLIPTFSGIVAKANQSRALQEATNAYKNLTYNSVNGESALIRDGYVFLSGDYAFTNIDGKLYQLEKMGEIGDEAFEGYPIMLGNYTVRGGSPVNAVFDLGAADFNVYQVKNPNGAGTYYFMQEKENENNGQDIGLENVYEAACLLTTENLAIEDFSKSICLLYDKSRDFANRDKVEIDDDLIPFSISSDWKTITIETEEEICTFNDVEFSVSGGSVTITADWLKQNIDKIAVRPKDQNYILFE